MSDSISNTGDLVSSAVVVISNDDISTALTTPAAVVSEQADISVTAANGSEMALAQYRLIDWVKQKLDDCSSTGFFLLTDELKY
jgi:hypothetical protein